MTIPAVPLPSLRAFLGAIALTKTATATAIRALYKLENGLTQNDVDVRDVVNALIDSFDALPLRRTATDASTYLCWTLDETAAPFLNTGSASSGSLDTAAGAGMVADRCGLHGGALYFPAGTGNHYRTASAALTPASTTAFTIHGLFKLRAMHAGAQFPRLISKGYNTGYTGTAQDAFAILFNGSSVGQLIVQTGTTGGTVNKQALVATTHNPTVAEWHHIAVTNNAGTLLVYLDGNLVHTDATFPAAWDWGTGYWYLGGTPTNTSIDGDLDEWRVESGVVRSAAYLRSVYQYSLGRFG